MAYEIDFLPVGDGESSGDAIALRYGNLADPTQQMVIVIDGGYTDDGEALVEHINKHYNTNYVDVVVSTHPDQDHVTGLEVVLQRLSVGQLWMHQPWKHSGSVALSRASNFETKGLSQKVQASLKEASDLEQIANRRNVPIVEPFTGLSTDDGCFFVVGPDESYYEELLGDLPQSALQAALRAAFSKASDAAQRFVPESLYIETLTDSGETTAQNNTSVVSILQVDDRVSVLTGDAGMPALERALDELESRGFYGGMAKFVQIPHHGSRRNVGPTVLNRLLGDRGSTDKRGTAFVSAAKLSKKHPAKKVTNAFLRRGYPAHSTEGIAKHHHHQAPDRPGWISSDPLPLYTAVEDSD